MELLGQARVQLHVGGAGEHVVHVRHVADDGLQVPAAVRPVQAVAVLGEQLGDRVAGLVQGLCRAEAP